MLPYVTEAEIIKVCKELIANSKSESKNKYPTLNYTLDELKQYSGVTIEEIPIEVIENIDECATMHWQIRTSTYVEFQTKDGYTFKGVIVLPAKEGEPVNEIEDIIFTCPEGDAYTRTDITYNIEHDSETGDLRLVLVSIYCSTR